MSERAAVMRTRTSLQPGVGRVAAQTQLATVVVGDAADCRRQASPVVL